MSGSKHTPGPWFVFGNGHCVGGPFEPGEGDDPDQTTAGVAMCRMRLRHNDEAAANARLIAAAPDLLAALSAVIGAWLYESSQGDGILEEHSMIINDARAVIAKAKGGR